MAYKTTVDKKFDGDFNITIYHRLANGYEEITPVVEDGVKWETDRKDSPGKLTFKVYADKNKDLNFQEGDEVHLNFYLDGTGWMVLFYGFVFTKKRNKDGWIDVTAYDCLRYFKNKDTIPILNNKASDVLKRIADKYLLKVGTIEDTSYVIGQRIEDNQCLFDIVQNALDDTLVGSKKMYVLYADGTGVCLRNVENMKTDLVINHSVAEDFDYSSSIDDETYSEVELYYDDSENNRRQYYHAHDSTNINKWGRLRLLESIQTPTNAEDRVKKMLTLYNRKKRKLAVKGTFGDYRCRAGASVIVDLDLGDLTVSNYMLIEKATHIFKKNEYRMDLTLEGFNEDVSDANVTYKSWTLQGETPKKTETKTEVDTGQTTPEQVAEPKARTVTVEIKNSSDNVYAQAAGLLPIDIIKKSIGTLRVVYADENRNRQCVEITPKYLPETITVAAGTTVFIGATENYNTLYNVEELANQGWTWMHSHHPSSVSYGDTFKTPYQLGKYQLWHTMYKPVKTNESITIEWNVAVADWLLGELTKDD